MWRYERMAVTRESKSDESERVCKRRKRGRKKRANGRCQAQPPQPLPSPQPQPPPMHGSWSNLASPFFSSSFFFFPFFRFAFIFSCSFFFKQKKRKTLSWGFKAPRFCLQRIPQTPCKALGSPQGTFSSSLTLPWKTAPTRQGQHLQCTQFWNGLLIVWGCLGQSQVRTRWLL